MSPNDFREHLKGRLAAAEEDLKRLEREIAQCNLRLIERDVNGERDVTDLYLKDAKAMCEEY